MLPTLVLWGQLYCADWSAGMSLVWFSHTFRESMKKDCKQCSVLHLNSSPLYLSIPSSANGLKTQVFSEIVLSVLGHWLFIPCGFSNATLSLFLYLYSLPLRFYHCDDNVPVVILGIFQPEKNENLPINLQKANKLGNK